MYTMVILIPIVNVMIIHNSIVLYVYCIMYTLYLSISLMHTIVHVYTCIML